jgi:hypothetical protein
METVSLLKRCTEDPRDVVIKGLKAVVCMNPMEGFGTQLTW